MGSIQDLRPITYLKLHKNCLKAWTNKSWVNSWHRTKWSRTSLLNSKWLPRYLPATGEKKLVQCHQCQEFDSMSTFDKESAHSPICFFDSRSCLNRNLATESGLFSRKPFSCKYFNPLSGCKLNCLTP